MLDVLFYRSSSAIQFNVTYKLMPRRSRPPWAAAQNAASHVGFQLVSGYSALVLDTNIHPECIIECRDINAKQRDKYTLIKPSSNTKLLL